MLRDEKEKAQLLNSESTLTNGVQMSTVESEDVDNSLKTIIDEDLEQSSKLGIVISNVSAKWMSDQPENSLSNINLVIRPGRLVAIIGPVGGGKVCNIYIY